jgi:putative transcriptional regulator
MQSLENQFLIAMPSLEDSYFARSITYLCEHNDQGTMGIVINQPVGMSLGELLTQTIEDATVLPNYADQIVLAGGPVNRDRGFILHTAQSGYSSSLSITSDIMVTTSKDILPALGDGSGPENSLVALGYAGWTAGQLEEELQDNAWLTVEADLNLLFDVPIHKKWEKALQKLGVNIWQLGSDVGHA